MAVKVKLLQKKISGGRKTLYLDFYPAIISLKTGKETRREFLGLYIHEKPKNAIEKQYNAEQLKLAEAIRQQKENTHNKPEIYNEYEKERLRKKELGDRDFVEYFRRTAGKRSGSNHNNWMSALTYLEQFTGGRVKFADLSEQYLEEFKEYLLTTQSVKSKRKKEPLSQNSALSYFNKVKATLKQAYKEGILQTDLNARVDSIKAAETRREYLTSEELNKLAKTPCKDDLLKRAALFSGLTGLRFSDIEKLTWGEIGQDESKGYTINFQQKKDQRHRNDAYIRTGVQPPRRAAEAGKPDIRRTAFGILPQQRPAGLAESGRNNEAHHVPLLPAHVRYPANVPRNGYFYRFKDARPPRDQNHPDIH